MWLPTIAGLLTMLTIECFRRARFSPAMGTTVNFENHACRAAELRLPPGGGEELDVHQHCLDYGLVFLGDSSTKMCTLHSLSRAARCAKWRVPTRRPSGRKRRRAGAAGRRWRHP